MRAMTALLRIVLLSTAFGHQAWAATSKMPAATVCSSVLPTAVNELLTSQFPKWRLKQLSDLESYDRQLWLKAHPQECPGVAAGHYQSSDELSYAVLLVPKSNRSNGYQLIVVSKKTQSSYTWKLLDSSEAQPNSGAVVSKVKPGKYSDPERSKSITTKSDAIDLEWLEQAAVLYYWSSGRYLKLQISD
jgi:hypothetical protein